MTTSQLLRTALREISQATTAFRFPASFPEKLVTFAQTIIIFVFESIAFS